MSNTRKSFLMSLSSLGLVSSLLLAGCAGGTSSAGSSEPSAGASSGDSNASASQSPIVEGKGAATRLAITYDGGVMVYDGKDMKLLQDIHKDGFLRLNDAGDNRHLIVADGSSYTFLDTGAASRHSHFRPTIPGMLLPITVRLRHSQTVPVPSTYTTPQTWYPINARQLTLKPSRLSSPILTTDSLSPCRMTSTS